MKIPTDEQLEGMYENPMELMFALSMAQQLKLSEDTDVSAEQRTKALNDLQTTFLAKTHMHDHAEVNNKVAKAAISMTEQARRLRDDEE